MSRIRILEPDPNKRGDLFGRLMVDLFLALGYDEARMNVQKAGREIDLQATHRTEKRFVVAECKATEDPIGGADINKFIGVLDAEKRQRSQSSAVGYFVSLSGFTEAAIEQEQAFRKQRLILLDAAQILNELIKGRILISRDMALQCAARLSSGLAQGLKPESQIELLAHRIGWIWVVFFSRNKLRQAYALVHADGEALAAQLAEDVASADHSVGGTLQNLAYLAPSPSGGYPTENTHIAQDRYLSHLVQECGEITLEGLPADQDVGSKRLRIENVFVPLHLKKTSVGVEYTPVFRGRSDNLDLLASLTHPYISPAMLLDDAGAGKSAMASWLTKQRIPVGTALSQHPKLAILAPPGGGKSTLLKRLAVAYAIKDRRAEIDDQLPDRHWLPVLIRCRQLGELAERPIWDIFKAIPQRGEFADLERAFLALLKEAFQQGRVLLLVDGLDEIPTEGVRLAFVKQLRTFLSTYPTASVVITSRKAGFRVVGGTLSAHCEHYELAEFDEADIRRLTVAWHKEVVGDRPTIVEDAEKLARAICNNERVRELAKTPLLLTTLLLVKRWVGQLPNRRSALYAKAIEVLLMTWNVEAHDPVDQEEALPQLAYLAFSMMKDGKQRISLKLLRETLIASRKQSPEIFAYARHSVSEFVRRVELRSSLLTLVGHDEEDGEIQPFYEFHHLTFQEYLAAQAIVEGFYPGKKLKDTILSVLRPFLRNEQWREVIPLVGVLAGRRVQPLMVELIRQSARRDRKKPTGAGWFSPRGGAAERLDWRSVEFFHIWGHGHGEHRETVPPILLAQCLADEVQIPPQLLERALLCVIEASEVPGKLILEISRGKYGEMINRVLEGSFADGGRNPLAAAERLCQIIAAEFGLTETMRYSARSPEVARAVQSLLEDGCGLSQARGASLALHLFRNYTSKLVLNSDGLVFYRDRVAEKAADVELGEEFYERLHAAVIELVQSSSQMVRFIAVMALSESCARRSLSCGEIGRLLHTLVPLWRKEHRTEFGKAVACAIAATPAFDRSEVPVPPIPQDMERFLRSRVLKRRTEVFGPEAKAALITAFYLRRPWEDRELAQLFGRWALEGTGLARSSRPREYLEILGPVAKDALKAIVEKEKAEGPIIDAEVVDEPSTSNGAAVSDKQMAADKRSEG